MDTESELASFTAVSYRHLGNGQVAARMSEDGAPSVVTGERPRRRCRPDPVPRTPGRCGFLLTAILSAILVPTVSLALPQAPPVEVPWILAFAGMTEGAPALGVSGARADGKGEHRWIPAFAGMTMSAPAVGESGAATRAVGEPRLVSTSVRVAAPARIGHRPGRGMFLLAAPRLRDPRFAQTVVLLLEYGQTGALGLVINRPTEASLHDVLATPLPNSEGHAVFAGGPVELPRLIALLRSPVAVDGAERLFGDVHASGSMDTLRRVLERDGQAADVHVYLGYAGWAPGQLDAEIARGDWIVTPADAESVFDTPPGDVWPDLMRRNAGRWVRAGPARPA